MDRLEAYCGLNKPQIDSNYLTPKDYQVTGVSWECGPTVFKEVGREIHS